MMYHIWYIRNERVKNMLIIINWVLWESLTAQTIKEAVDRSNEYFFIVISH